MINPEPNPTISIVVPCFNESEVIKYFLEEIYQVLNKTNKTYEIIFVNDGSHDSTLETLIKLKEKNKNIRIINLSRNFGKEAALTAGLDKALGEAIICIDADLQHPPETIIEFIKMWEEGYDVVVGKRIRRIGEGIIKKIITKSFYKIHNKISNVDIPYNIGDFRLMSKRVVQSLKTLPENQRFMKGIFAWLGYKTAVVKYEQNIRVAGQTSFNGWKLWNFALEGITSFSTVPLRIWFYIGFIVAFFAFISGIWIIIKTLVFGIDVAGYASTITIMCFLGGIQLLGIGVLGEYIGRIYMEAKNRPIYIIENEY